jgi:hypothetical protein
MFFTNKATFGTDGIKISTTSISGQKSIHVVHVIYARHQQQFWINVWAGNVGGCLVG